MNTIDQTKAGCFLLNIASFGVQNRQTFNKRVLQGKAIQIEGIYTYPDTSYTVNYRNKKEYTARRQGKDFFDYRNLSILIDGEIIKGNFGDMYNSRIRYYLNNEGNQAVIHISRVLLEYNDMFKGMCSSKISHSWFALVTNTPLSYMDVVATKLVSY